MDPPSPLEEYRRIITEFYEELSELLESEDALHDAQYIVHAQNVLTELNQMNPMDGSEATDLLMLRGMLMLCISQVQIDYDTSETFSVLIQMKSILLNARQEPEIIWLYSHNAYLLGEYFFERDNFHAAVKHYMEAEENMAEFLVVNAGAEPFELGDILETTTDDIFMGFSALRDCLNEKILFIGKMMNNQDILFCYGIPGLTVMLQENYDRRRDKFEYLLECLACVTEVYIERLFFHQAQHFIRFFEYLVQKYDETWLETNFFASFYKNLFVMYVERYLKAVRDYRQKSSSIKGHSQLFHEYFQDEETDLLGDQLTYILEMGDYYIEKLLATTHDVMKDLKIENHKIEKYGNELLGESISPKSPEICDFKTKFMQNLSSCVNENQRFALLAKMEIEARSMVEAIDEETSVLFEEAALNTCAIGLLLVKDFNYDAHHASKCSSILNHCEMLAETYRLLPNGLTIFMLSKYLQATALMKSGSHENLKIALLRLKEASSTFDEYQEVNFGVEPKNLLEILDIHTDRNSRFQTVYAEILVHRVRLASLKVTLLLGDFELLQQTGIENIKSVFYLFDRNRIMMKPFLEVVLAFSYELLERNRLAQVNHLITCATKVIGSCPFREKAELEVLRLCYLHTLICQSVVGLEENLQEEMYFERITEHEDIVRDDNLFPSKLITNCYEMQELMEKAIKMAEMFEKRKYFDNDIVEMIKIHLIGLQEKVLSV
ncbi:uncharacterized protein LOC134833775 [Culicoides brevitarsis]|uniref:uncharacterized protein LOC134833775 n=1 Tax=Culicoides brevitarsis TaxID=469753 RepID=UPI00307B51FB